MKDPAELMKLVNFQNMKIRELGLKINELEGQAIHLYQNFDALAQFLIYMIQKFGEDQSGTCSVGIPLESLRSVPPGSWVKTENIEDMKILTVMEHDTMEEIMGQGGGGPVPLAGATPPGRTTPPGRPQPMAAPPPPPRPPRHCAPPPPSAKMDMDDAPTSKPSVHEVTLSSQSVVPQDSNPAPSTDGE